MCQDSGLAINPPRDTAWARAQVNITLIKRDGLMQRFAPAKQGRTVPCHRVQLPELQVMAGSPVGPQDTAQHPRPPAARPSQGPSPLARQLELVSLINPAFAPLRMLLLFQSSSCFVTCLFTCCTQKTVLPAVPPAECLDWASTSIPGCNAGVELVV